MAEIVLLDDEMVFRLSQSDYNGARLYWLNHLNGKPIQEHGLHLIAKGIVSPSDVEWQIGLLSSIYQVPQPIGHCDTEKDWSTHAPPEMRTVHV